MTRRTLRPLIAATAAVTAGLAALAGHRAAGRLGRYAVAESSMEPALRPGDYLICDFARPPQRGDVVVYPDPTRPDRDLLKRAIGLGGERVTISDGNVAINGNQLFEPWARGATFSDGEWAIPAGEIFTLGDNRSASSGDSRATGPVPSKGMCRVVWRYWPAGSIGRL